MPDVSAARLAFPRGLEQPERGYRFSLDSLLLAAFARPPARGHGLDLGTGCGVVGLGMLLRHAGADLRVTGVDVDSAMVDAANRNAALLGLECRFEARILDAARLPGHEDFPPESLDFALCNPPYRRPGTGRRPPDKGRDVARFEASGRLEHFLNAAGRVLKKRKPLWLVFLPERLEALLAGLSDAGLAAKRLRFVHPRDGEPSRILLAEAVAHGKPGMTVEPPLILHEGEGRDTRLTVRALDFCPWLACNSGQEKRNRSG